MTEKIPNTAEGFYKRGRAYLKNGKHDLAIADFNETLRLDPGYSEALMERGNAYAGKGDREKAKQDFHQAMKDEQFLERLRSDIEYRQEIGWTET